MSVKTTYTCDLCGATQDTPEQFWVVEATVRSITSATGYSSTSKLKQWCRACCEVYDILPTINPRITDVEPPTFEDMIREIVREEIGDVER